MLTVRSLPTQEVPPGRLADIRVLLDGAFRGDPDGDFDDDDWGHTIGGLHVIVLEDDLIVAHAALLSRTIEVDGRPFRTGYVEGVATLPHRRGERLGWERWRGPSYVRRHDGSVERTAEDDDGLMVLRTGPSAAIDLASPITCDDRPGDCW
jgi:aminoglycoside 2'-N-acetyltransferase I